MEVLLAMIMKAIALDVHLPSTDPLEGSIVPESSMLINLSMPWVGG